MRAEAAYVVRKVRSEAARHKGTRRVAAGKEVVCAAGAVVASALGYVKHGALDGQLRRSALHPE